MNKKTKKLRRGFSTGCCCAAAAKAAYELLSSQRSAEELQVKVRLLNREECVLSLHSIQLVSSTTAIATIIKDAGDDPDVTNKMKLQVMVSFAEKTDAGTADYLEECGSGQIIITAAGGVGFVSRAGLNVPAGKWAINAGPRKMIKENLLLANFYNDSVLRVCITADNGEAIAKRTLNPKLGITGGISILGTSGRVEPFSNTAYVDTIKLHLQSLKAASKTTAVFATGNLTLKKYAELSSDFEVADGIRIADFIAEALRAAKQNRIDKVCICCMPGKLYKYGCGYENTHAHKNELNTDLIIEIVNKLWGDKQLQIKLKNCRTVKEMLELLPEEQRTTVLAKLGERALNNFRKWNDFSRLELYLFDTTGILTAIYK